MRNEAEVREKEIHHGRVEARVIAATVAGDEMKEDISQTGNQTG